MQVMPAIVNQVAQQTVRDQRGSVSAHYQRVFDAHAGPRSRHEQLDFIGVYRDGNLVSVRVTNDVTDGKAATPAQIAQVISDYEHPKPTDSFHAPWDPRYLGDYTYRTVDSNTIAFTSHINDTAHGSGMFSFDAHKHVVAYRYTPSAFYDHATAGTVVGRRAQVLSGYWALTQETQTFRGHYTLFAGGATAQISQSDFRRLPG